MTIIVNSPRFDHYVKTAYNWYDLHGQYPYTFYGHKEIKHMAIVENGDILIPTGSWESRDAAEICRKQLEEMKGTFLVDFTDPEKPEAIYDLIERKILVTHFLEPYTYTGTYTIVFDRKGNPMKVQVAKIGTIQAINIGDNLCATKTKTSEAVKIFMDYCEEIGWSINRYSITEYEFERELNPVTLLDLKGSQSADFSNSCKKRFQKILGDKYKMSQKTEEKKPEEKKEKTYAEGEEILFTDILDFIPDVKNPTPVVIDADLSKERIQAITIMPDRTLLIRVKDMSYSWNDIEVLFGHSNFTITHIREPKEE